MRLPDYKRTVKAQNTFRTPDAREFDTSGYYRKAARSQQQGVNELLKGVEAIGRTSQHIYQREEEKKTSLQLLDAENEMAEKTRLLDEELRTYRGEDRTQKYAERQAAYLDEASSKIGDSHVRSKFRKQYTGILQNKLVGVERDTRRFREDEFMAKVKAGQVQRRELLSSSNATPEQYEQALAKDVADYNALYEQGQISAVKRNQGIRESKKAYSKLIILGRASKDPGATRKALEGVLKGRQDGTFKSSYPATVLPSGTTKSEKAKLRDEGKFVVNWDFNSTKDRKPTTPMVVLPDDASDEEIAAAQAWADGVGKIWEREFGRQTKPRVVLRKDNIVDGKPRGSDKWAHLEIASVHDKQAIDFLRTPEGLREVAELSRETIGQVPNGAIFSEPHDEARGDTGAVGPYGSEVQLSRPILAELGKEVEAQGPIELASAESGFNPTKRLPSVEALEMSLFAQNLTEPEIQEMIKSIKVKEKGQAAELYRQDLTTLEGINEKIRQFGEVTPEMKQAQEGIKSRLKSLGRDDVWGKHVEGQKIALKFNKASTGKETIGVDKPLEQMSDRELAMHVNKLKPKKSDTAEEFRRNQIVHAEIKKKALKIEELRREDPALSVENHPAVVEANEAIESVSLETRMSARGEPVEGQERFQFMPPEIAEENLPPDIPESADQQTLAFLKRQRREAIVQAQIEYGIAPDDARLVTQREADQYFDYSPGEGGYEREGKKAFKESIDALYERLATEYQDKDLAARMVKDIYELQIGKRSDRNRASVVGKTIDTYLNTGRFPTEEEMKRLKIVTDQGARATFEASVPEGMAKPVPTQENIDKLLENIQNPEARASFYRTFGPEAYRDATLGKQSQPTPENK